MCTVARTSPRTRSSSNPANCSSPNPANPCADEHARNTGRISLYHAANTTGLQVRLAQEERPLRSPLARRRTPSGRRAGRACPRVAPTDGADSGVGAPTRADRESPRSTPWSRPSPPTRLGQPEPSRGSSAALGLRPVEGPSPRLSDQRIRKSQTKRARRDHNLKA